VAWERRPFWSLFAVFLPPVGGRQDARFTVQMATDITDQHFGFLYATKISELPSISYPMLKECLIT
jgi:hypothetical protein